MIALVRPLVDAGIVSQGVGLVVHAISGYSGGGKQLMAIHQTGEAEPWGAYGAWNREPDEKTSRTLRITS
jgi:N-acetyl-gamma-glutamyl-phosphate reductase